MRDEDQLLNELKRVNENIKQLRDSTEEVLRAIRETTSVKAFQPEGLGQLLNELQVAVCYLEQISKQTCNSLNESHYQTGLQRSIGDSLNVLVDLYKTEHTDAALELERLRELNKRIVACCPPEEPKPICQHADCRDQVGGELGQGYSISQQGMEISATRSQGPYKPYKINLQDFEEDQEFPEVPVGMFRGFPKVQDTSNVMDIRGGTAGGSDPVSFAVYTPTGKAVTTGYYPPDPSGAASGKVVLMTGNFYLGVSIDGGTSFCMKDPTTIFPRDITYGGWGCDQNMIYAPSINRFIWLMQAFPGTGGVRSSNDVGQNVIRLAYATPEDIITFKDNLSAAWHYYDTDSNYFGLGTNNWMDYPAVAIGDNFLYISIDDRNDYIDSSSKRVNSSVGRLVIRIPLNELRDGLINNLRYTHSADSSNALKSQVTQNTGSEVYWAAHGTKANGGNGTMTVYSWNENSTSYFWRDVALQYNWPNGSSGILTSQAPDFPDWLELDKGIGNGVIGATVRSNEIWFAWTAHSGDGGHGGFKFPHPHVQLVKFNRADYTVIDHLQIWNPDHAFAYANLATNSDNEVGVSLAWGGGGKKYYGSHAVGIMGDFIVWYPELSEVTLQRQVLDSSGNPVNNPDGTPKLQTRWGDYVTVRQASLNSRLFGGFGYAVLKDAGISSPNVGKPDPYYILFGRNSVVNPGPIIK